MNDATEFDQAIHCKTVVTDLVLYPCVLYLLTIKPLRSLALDTGLVLENFLIHVEKRAFRMAYLATSSREDALDIVQDAMLKLVKRYRGRSEEELSMLFTRILQNQIRDWYRREKVRSSVNFILGNRLVANNGKSALDSSNEDPLEQLPDAGMREPLENMANQKAMITLDHAVKQLPFRQKQAFLLRMWEGLDVAQTAKAMGCTQGSVKTHYSRAIHSLRETLGEHWLWA